MALFNKISAIAIPEEGKTINGLMAFKNSSGRVVKEKIRRFHKTEMKFIMIETGNNGSTKRETFFCPHNLLGRFKDVRLTNKLVTITPDLMHWVSENNSCRIDKNGASLSRIGRQQKQSERAKHDFRFKKKLVSPGR